nr:Fibronectin type III domain containing protein [Hymenolepis microstoma]
MLEEHSQENNIKPSFFSRSSKYQLDVNSVYRPKYSTLMLDEPLSKPFFSRNDGKSSDKVKSVARSDLSTSSSTESLSVKSNRDSSLEWNVSPTSPTIKSKPDESNPSLKSEVPTNDSVKPCELGDFMDKLDNKLSSGTENLTPSEESQKCDTLLTSVPTPPQVSESPKSNTSFTSTFTPTPLMDLPPSIYLPSFHLNPVFLNPNVASFAPTPIESLMNPVIAPQMFSQQPSMPLPRKPFSRSKNKHTNNPPEPLFQDNGLYGLGFPQNGTNKEYYVMVHVEAGATFSIRTGDQEQQIPGPATVRLVVNNGPPLPMSMQVPPGHLVQQIVDEDGILTHLILTPVHPYPQYNGTIGNSALPRPPNFVSPNSRLPPRLFASGNSGLNVVISPKTAPGLAIAGPTWPGPAPLGPPIPLQHGILPSIPPGADFLSASTAVIVGGEINALNPHPPAQPLIETRRKSKTEKQTTCVKKETVEEVPTKSQSDSRKASSSASARTKKQPAASSNSKKKSSLDTESSKTRCRNPRKCSSKESTTEDSSSKKISNCNGETNIGRSDPKDSLDSTTPDVLRDDFPSVTIDDLDGKSKMELAPRETDQSEDTSQNQRSIKPVNIVRPTNGGRPLPLLNGDLTPAEACELKASLGGRLNGRPLNSSTLTSLSNSTTTNSTTPATIPSDNVWTARKLAALNNTSETSSTAAAPSNTTSTSDQPEKSGDKVTKQSTPSTPTKISKSSGSEKLKKAPNKGGDTLKSKGGSESVPNEKKSGKKNQHQQQNLDGGVTDSSNTIPTTMSTVLDVTDPLPSTFLPNGAQPAFYAPPHFYTAGGPFFPGPHHVPPHPPHGCFLPPHQSQNHHLPPYVFSGTHPGVPAPPYLSFQPPHLVPTGPMHHPHPAGGQSVAVNQGAGSNSSGPQLIGLPPPYVGTNPTAVAALAASAASGIGMSEEERSAIVQVLSKIAPPKISEVGCNNVTINISLPEGIADPLTSTEDNSRPIQAQIKDENSTELETSKNSTDEEGKSKERCTPDSSQSNTKTWSISPSDLGFALYLAERNDNYVCVYVGEVMSILLQDLRPGVHYNTKVCCMYEGLCGAASESAEFTTLTTIPAPPRLPNVFARTKSSLCVRWAVPADNGSKITSYRLQCGTVTKGGTHYDSPPEYKKCTMINCGKQPWSEVVSVTTHGLPPSPPDPPRLQKSGTRSLHLTWEPQSKAGTSSSFPCKPIIRYQLEMQEGEARQHFKSVYDGDAVTFLVEGLRRCSLYRFRLCASNADGVSHWSDIVAFRTDPDPPSTPKGLRLRGRVRPYHVNLYWFAPDDDGGAPVNAYRLEILMPRLPTALLRKYSNQQNINGKKENGHRLQPNSNDADEIKAAESKGFICWPWVISTSNSNRFTSVPPAKYLLQPPTSSVYTLGKASGNVQPPLRIPNSPDPIGSPLDESDNNLSPFDLHEPEATGDSPYSTAWYSIYEGHCKEVTVCNLTPGQTFYFRVRATSHRNGSLQPNSRITPTPSVIYWGSATTSPLKIITPAVPPINPPSNLRLLGRAKANELRLVWDPPTSNGGAPIISYELWQSLIDPDSGSPIKTGPIPMASISSSGSMNDLYNSNTSSKKTVVSAPNSVHSTPEHAISHTRDSRLVFAGSENNCEVRELHSGQMFTFRVRAKNCTGWSGWSEWTTFATAPSPPNSLLSPPLVKSTSPTSVHVSWEAAEQTNGAPITEYRVEFQPNAAGSLQSITPSKRNDGDEMALLPTEADEMSRAAGSHSNDGFQLVHSGIERQFEIHDLQPASRVAFRVCAVNSAGTSGWSPMGFCILPAAQPDQPPSLQLDSSGASAYSDNEVSVGGVSMTTAQLVWLAPMDNGCPITCYNIEVTHYDNFQTLLAGSNGYIIKYIPLKVHGDEAIQDLSASIVSSPDEDEEEKSLLNRPAIDVNEIAGSTDIKNIFCVSEPTNLPPFRPSSVSPSLGIDSASALSSNMSTESGSSRQQPKHYRHHGGITRSMDLRTRRLSSASMAYVHYTLTDLEVGTKYRVRVQALNAVGASPFSESLHFSTLPPLPPPPTLCCIGTTANGIKLRWSSSPTEASIEVNEETPSVRQNRFSSSLNSTNIRYILEMRKKPESKGWTTIFEGPQTSFKARKLSEATMYYFRVAAVNISGEGPFSEVLCEKTAFSQPSPVEAPQVTEVSNATCKLQWPAMSSMGQDPLLYQVQLTRVSSGFSLESESQSLITPTEVSKVEETITAYRGAETSCTLSNLLSGTNYIARVCAIRCCQTEFAPKNEEDLMTSINAKITLLQGPYSVGTAFTTLPEKKTAIEVFIAILSRSRQYTSSGPPEKPSPNPKRSGGVLSSLNHLATGTIHRARTAVTSVRRSIFAAGGHSNRERAQKQMAILMVVGFAVFTMMFAWFAHQYLLKFADDVGVKWSSGSLDDSSSSSRAAVYARGRQLRQ